MVVLLLRESARAPTPLIDARARASFTRARELHASPRAQFQWLRIGDTGNFHKRDSYVSEHTNISLISTLLFTVAVSGMFMAPEWTDWASIDDEDSWRLKHLHEAYGFFWCFATFCELSASFISLIFLIGSNEINTEVQFEHFQLASGIALRLPFVLSFAGFLFMYVGLVLHLVLTYGDTMAFCCVLTCFFFMFPFFYAFLRMTWALLVVHKTETHIKKLQGIDHGAIEKVVKDVRYFLSGVTFMQMDVETISHTLIHQGINVKLLLCMKDEDFTSIPALGFGDAIRIREAAAKQRVVWACVNVMMEDLTHGHQRAAFAMLIRNVQSPPPPPIAVPQKKEQGFWPSSSSDAGAHPLCSS